MHSLADEIEVEGNDLVQDRERLSNYLLQNICMKKKSCTYLTVCLNQTTNDKLKGLFSVQ